MGQNLHKIHTTARTGRAPDLAALLREQLAAVDAGALPVHIPSATGLMRRYGATHFHVKAEYNFQVSGVCRLLTFTEKLRVPAGTAVILPHGVPHKALAAPCRAPFCMLAVEHHRPGVITFLLSHANGENLRVATMRRQPTRVAGRLADYLEDIAALHYSRRQPREQAVKGLLLAYLEGLLAELKRHDPAPAPAEHWQVARCRDLVAAHLSETNLCVKMLADALELAPDYLSHLFATRAGMTLTTYINQARVDYARKLLTDAALSVKEIAWAAGYRDPGYFIRVFHRLTGTTPKTHRSASV